MTHSGPPIHAASDCHAAERWECWDWTTAPSEKLEVNGNVLANNVAVPSDARYKTDIAPITSSLGIVERLDGVEYFYDRASYPEKAFEPGMHLGLIAQDVHDVLPGLVRENESGYLSVNHVGLIPVFLEAIKEQQSEMDRKDSRIEALEARMGDLEKWAEVAANLQP